MHFTCLVVGDDPESQLAPFQENNMGDCPEEYLEFDDNTEEWQEEYETGTMDAVKIGKKYYLRGDKKFKHTDKDGTSTYDFPKGSKVQKIPINKIYKTFDEYCKKYHGTEAKEDGRYGYTYNPNSRWDWYQIGGRWVGNLVLKPGCIGDTGERSWGNTDEEIPYNHVSQAKKDDIDWDVMYKTRQIELEKQWDEYAKTSKEPGIFSDLKQYKTKEEYLEAELGVLTHSILHNGEWIDEPTGKQTKEIIDNLDYDTLLTIVDCHVQPVITT